MVPCVSQRVMSGSRASRGLPLTWPALQTTVLALLPEAAKPVCLVSDVLRIPD